MRNHEVLDQVVIVRNAKNGTSLSDTMEAELLAMRGMNEWKESRMIFRLSQFGGWGFHYQNKKML